MNDCARTVTIPLQEYEELKWLKEIVDSKAIVAKYEGYRSTSYYAVGHDELSSQIEAAIAIANDRHEKSEQARDRIMHWLDLPLRKRLFKKP